MQTMLYLIITLGSFSAYRTCSRYLSALKMRAGSMDITSSLSIVRILVWRLVLAALISADWMISGPIAAQTVAQTPAQVLVRDPLAIQRLTLVLTALGGLQNIGRMDSCVEEATRTSFNYSSSVKRFNVGDDYRYEVTLDGTVNIRTSRRTRKMDSTSSSDINKRDPLLSGRGQSVALPAISAAMPVVPHLAPAVLLRRMLDTATGLEFVPTDQLPVGAVGILMKKTQPVTKQVEEQRWFFDSQSNLPLSVTYWLPSVTSLRNHAVLHAKFESYRDLSGFTVPQVITTSLGSLTLGTETINSLKCQQAISNDLFTSPEVK